MLLLPCAVIMAAVGCVDGWGNHISRAFMVCVLWHQARAPIIGVSEMLVTCDLNHVGTASMKHAISVCVSVVVTPWWLSPVLSLLHLWYTAVDCCCSKLPVAAAIFGKYVSVQQQQAATCLDNSSIVGGALLMLHSSVLIVWGMIQPRADRPFVPCLVCVLGVCMLSDMAVHFASRPKSPCNALVLSDARRAAQHHHAFPPHCSSHKLSWHGRRGIIVGLL